MHEDPFARFERSRGGWLIPIAVFVAGAIGTTIALNMVHRLDLRDRAGEIEQEVPAMNDPDPTPAPEPADT